MAEMEEVMLNLGDLDLTSEDLTMDNVSIHIQENLEDALVQEALKAGVDLRQYSKQVESELQQIEHVSIRDYIEQSQNIASLHNQIIACDGILERMGLMLGGFQSDLSSISSEIHTLQELSLAMNIKLKNRQTVRSELSQLVDELIIPNNMISVILDVPVTEQQFVEQLQELNNKINYVKEQAFRDTKACADVQEILHKLKLKAVTKVREFILQKIYSFRKPMTNYQIPQNALLKYRFFYQFLLGNERSVAQEIQDEYVETMSKVYLSYFKSYTSRLMKVQYEEVAEKDDLMGIEDTAKKGFFSKPALRSRNTVFTVGNRAAIISPTELEGPIIVPHTVQRSDVRYPFESLFRSQHYALLDNSCREFLFLSDFFLVSGVAAQELFNAVMGRTLAMFLKHIDSYVSDCYDSIAIFLCIHIVLRFKGIAQRRDISAVDNYDFASSYLELPSAWNEFQRARESCLTEVLNRSTRSPLQSATCIPRYWDALLDMLWPRFQHILELNIQSIRNMDPQRLGTLDTRPHYITRRYAEFSSAIVSINQTFPNEKTNLLLGQLQGEVENFVLRMAAEFGSRKEQLIFLINNYDMMLGVLMERASSDSKEVESFQMLLNARTQEFIEEILAPSFGGMIAFVKESETLIEKGQQDKLRSDEVRVAQLVRGFSSTWKQAVETLSQDVMRSFTNFKNGTSIIQGALTQLIQYYHRFHKILSQPPLRNLPVCSELINLHHLMVELKKHKPNF